MLVEVLPYYGFGHQPHKDAFYRSLRPGGAGIESLTGAPTAFFYAKAVNHMAKCPGGHWATSHAAWYPGGYDPLALKRGGACQTDNTVRFSGAFVAPSTGACTLWLACPGTGCCSLAIDGHTHRM